MDPARIFISIPFRIDGKASEHPGCLQTFDSRQINRYLAALEKDIAAAAEDSDDLQIQEIILGNGSACHLTADDLTAVVSLVRKHFSVISHFRFIVHTTPSGFDFYKLSAIRHLGRAIVIFDIPALTDEGLLAAGYHCDCVKAAAALSCCFENGFRDFACSVSAAYSNPEQYASMLRQILSFQPERIILPDHTGAEYVKISDTVPGGSGYLKEGNTWYRDSIPPVSLCRTQIGCGPYSISIFDGTAVRTTADFEYYCDHSDDFEALVTHGQNP